MHESKVQEAEYEAAFSRIKSATGISDPNMVFIKFINKDQVYASLEEQRQKYEEKIVALEKRADELNHTLISLQNANTFISSRHIREIDDQTFVSESRLHTEKSPMESCATATKRRARWYPSPFKHDWFSNEERSP